MQSHPQTHGGSPAACMEQDSSVGVVLLWEWNPVVIKGVFEF